jgi:hypothetical protein
MQAPGDLVLAALIVLALLFGLLFFTRLGGAYRGLLARRWPAVALAGAAMLALARGAVLPAAGLAALALLLWVAWPELSRLGRLSSPVHSHDTPEDSAARTLLGVGANATAGEIRHAYRTKMARAHPDRGGAHNEAARLTAARDRLLKKRR